MAAPICLGIRRRKAIAIKDGLIAGERGTGARRCAEDADPLPTA